MKEHRIRLVGRNEEEVALVISEQRGQTCALKLEVGDLRIEAEAEDFFDAFCLIRQQLQEHSLVPICYGSSINVYPSRMSRQMASGAVAYVLSLGESAERKVNIFSAGPDVRPASVEEQRCFYLKWLSSLEA